MFSKAGINRAKSKLHFGGKSVKIGQVVCL